MIKRYDRVFKDNIITYIHNRIQLESSDAVIAEEVMSRFPVWIKLYNCDNNTQKEFIKFLCYGMRMEMKMYKKENENDKAECNG